MSHLDDSLSPIAEAWLNDALAEHASIAAFSQLSLQLMALGAPPNLLRKCHEAALDEIEHAQAFFGLASQIAVRPLGPGPFPESQWRIKKLTLPELAVDSLVDGCLMEGWAASVLEESAEATEVPELQTTLKRIASDEVRHTELAWDIVGWCIGSGGEKVDKALRQALAKLPVSVQIEPLTGFESHGRLGREAQHQAFLTVRATVLHRAASLLQLSPSSPPSLINRLSAGMKGIKAKQEQDP